MPITLPLPAQKRLIEQMRAALRRRRENGTPEGEHPAITFLWNELIFLSKLSFSLLSFAQKNLEGGSGDTFIRFFERYTGEIGAETLSERMIELYRALTATDPVIITNPALRALIEEAKNGVNE